MNLDDLPNAARRALAARSMLAIHGFSDDQVFIGLGVQIAGFPVVDGTVHLALVIAKDGDPLAIHGFSDDQVFIGLGVQIAGFPVVDGTVHLALVIAKDGDPTRSCDFLWPVGPIDLAWWDQYGPPVLVETWNALTADQRIRERNRWITAEDEIRMGAALRRVGLLPPLSPPSRDGMIN